MQNAEVAASPPRNHVGIVDYGICNVGSVRNMLRRSGVLASLATHPDELVEFDRIILPGVGHFNAGMRNLRERGWIEPLRDFAMAQRKPVLGICLGMQLLAHHSEEGDCEGLGFLDMNVRHFNKERMPADMPVPHMGWSDVEFGSASKLTASSLPEKQRFYFVHSLHVVPRSEAVEALLWCNYGYPFVAAVAKDNVMGVQFHPEKSHMFGVEILTNFAGI